ncbi:MAG: CHRD domain-containing protein [Chitinophagales bacterium]
MKRAFTLCLILSLFFTAKSQWTYFKAELNGAQEVPASGSLATGIVIVKYNSINRNLQLVGDYQNLGSAAIDAHIHSPALPGVNAPVVVQLTHTGGTTGLLSVSAILSAADETSLLAGTMYVNVHSVVIPTGEIRGQLTATTPGQTEILTARIQAAQQVPPTASSGSGWATALLDKVTGMVYVTGNFSGLTTPANAAHIHTGAPNTNGPVIINFSFSAATSGTVHVASAITPGDMALMLNAFTYINVHTGTFGGGEVRGQLILESQLVFLKANLQGSQQVPPNASTAKGTAIVRYNTVTNALDLVGDYQGLAAAVSASHIHSPAAPGANAAVLINLTNTGGTTGVLTGTSILTDPQEADLLGGLMYVNVHDDPSFSAGEIRGQLTTATPGHAFLLTGSFSGAQEVPPTGSAGTGSVIVLLDNVTNEVFLTGNFSGLGAIASDAHIHEAATGVGGGVIVPLSATAFTAGTVTGNGIISNASADAMISGQTYVNIHTGTFPGGEIRAQLGNLVLPVKLTYFNGYKQGNKVALVWQSSEEMNLKQYEIEQADEAGAWINKAIVPAVGNVATSYNYLDLPILNRGNFVLYRLKMKDDDGKFAYSPVVKINFKESKAVLSIISNPVTDGQLKYIVTGLPANKKADVTIIDYNGRVVSRSTSSVFAINNINVTKLPAGVYRLVVRTDDNTLQQNFVK